MDDFDAVMTAITKLPNGTFIPKPQSDQSSRISKWGRRRGETALVYAMPNHSNPTKPHKKGITITEFRRAFEVLHSTGEFTRAWFQVHMPACNKEGACNFTTIGGLFELVYRRR
jgi:hypothetical protein